MTITLSSPGIAGTLITVSNVGLTSGGQTVPGFVNESGVLTDPTVVLLKWSVNGNAPTIYTYGVSAIIRVSAGIYYAQIDSTGLAGTWTVEWIGDPRGTMSPVCQAIIAGTFPVPSAPL